MIICPTGAELFHADRRRDTTKQIIAFLSFANVPKNGKVQLLSHSKIRIISGQYSSFNSVTPTDSQLHFGLQIARFCWRNSLYTPGNYVRSLKKLSYVRQEACWASHKIKNQFLKHRYLSGFV